MSKLLATSTVTSVLILSQRLATMSFVSVHKIVSKLKKDGAVAQCYNEVAGALEVQGSDYLEVENAFRNGTVNLYDLLKRIVELWLIRKGDGLESVKTVGELASTLRKVGFVNRAESLIESFGSASVIGGGPSVSTDISSLMQRKGWPEPTPLPNYSVFPMDVHKAAMILSRSYMFLIHFRQIADELGIPGHDVERIFADYRGSLPYDSARRLLTTWRDGVGIKEYGWTTLARALKRIGLRSLAEELLDYFGPKSNFEAEPSMPRELLDMLQNKWWPEQKPLPLSFVERSTSDGKLLVDGLDAMLNHEARKTVIYQQACISGLGGIGKTTLAKWYANHFSCRFDLIIWIDCGENSLSTSVEHLWKRLFPNQTDNTTGTAYKALDCFTKLQGLKALFIYDNAEHYEGSGGIKHILTSALEYPTTTCLVTSRWTSWGSSSMYGEILHWRLETLSIKESMHLLRKGLPNVDAKDKDLEELSKTLGYLPLALQIAIGHLNQHYFGRNDGVRFYNKALLQSYESLLEQDADLGDYQKGLLATLSQTALKVKEQGNLGAKAWRMLGSLAFLDPTVPLKFLCCVEDTTYEMGLTISGLLTKYSLVQQSGKAKDHNVTIHRLLQECLQRLSPSDWLEHPSRILGCDIDDVSFAKFKWNLYLKCWDRPSFLKELLEVVKKQMNDGISLCDEDYDKNPEEAFVLLRIYDEMNQRIYQPAPMIYMDAPNFGTKHQSYSKGTALNKTDRFHVFDDTVSSEDIVDRKKDQCTIPDLIPKTVSSACSTLDATSDVGLFPSKRISMVSPAAACDTVTLSLATQAKFEEIQKAIRRFLSYGRQHSLTRGEAVKALDKARGLWQLFASIGKTEAYLSLLGRLWRELFRFCQLTSSSFLSLYVIEIAQEFAGKTLGITFDANLLRMIKEHDCDEATIEKEILRINAEILHKTLQAIESQEGELDIGGSNQEECIMVLIDLFRSLRTSTFHLAYPKLSPTALINVVIAHKKSRRASALSHFELREYVHMFSAFNTVTAAPNVRNQQSYDHERISAAKSAEKILEEISGVLACDLSLPVATVTEDEVEVRSIQGPSSVVGENIDSLKLNIQKLKLKPKNVSTTVLDGRKHVHLGDRFYVQEDTLEEINSKHLPNTVILFLDDGNIQCWQDVIRYDLQERIGRHLIDAGVNHLKLALEPNIVIYTIDEDILSNLVDYLKNDKQWKALALPEIIRLDSPPCPLTSGGGFPSRVAQEDVTKMAQYYEGITAINPWQEYGPDWATAAMIDTGMALGTLSHLQSSKFPIFIPHKSGMYCAVTNSFKEYYDPVGHGTGVGCILANLLPLWSKVCVVKAYPDPKKGSKPGESGETREGVVKAAFDHLFVAKEAYNLKVINFSSGFEVDHCPPWLEIYVNAFHNKGVLLVGAAGNEGDKIPVGERVTPPATLPKCISVGRYDLDTMKIAASSSGGCNVDAVAPGISVINYADNKVDYGTSFAAPIVSAILVHLIMKYPKETPDMIRSRLVTTLQALECYWHEETGCTPEKRLSINMTLTP